MDALQNYLKEIHANVIASDTYVENGEVPKIMRDFYNKIKCAELPYGEIYDVELALQQSQQAPFSPDWFVFGQDHYFSYWLCYKGVSEDGCYFTCWDHESGNDIDEPICEDLLSFLQEMEEDAE